MHKDVKEILFHEKDLAKKIEELGLQISKDYVGLNPLCICILKGAVSFTADLIRQISIPIEIDFMSISSYGSSANSSGVVTILKDLDISCEGRHVLVVEDIIDTGLTLSYLLDMLKERNVASLKTVVLLDKPSRRSVNVEPVYRGFQIPDEFVVGYGLDYAEKYRNLSYVGVLHEDIYST